VRAHSQGEGFGGSGGGEAAAEAAFGSVFGGHQQPAMHSGPINWTGGGGGGQRRRRHQLGQQRKRRRRRRPQPAPPISTAPLVWRCAQPSWDSMGGGMVRSGVRRSPGILAGARRGGGAAPGRPRPPRQARPCLLIRLNPFGGGGGGGGGGVWRFGMQRAGAGGQSVLRWRGPAPPPYYQQQPQPPSAEFARQCPKYRGFTVSFNAIGAGKSTRKYLLLAVSELLTPLLLPANKNMIEAKCSCQLVMNTRSLYRRGAGDTWIKYQLLMVVAPTRAKTCAGAKRLIEGILPGSVNLEDATSFVPDNKPLVYGYQRVGITHHKYGEVYDLKSPTEPLRDRETGRILYAPWHMTKRERRGIFLSTKNFPLQRQLNIIGLLDMLLLGRRGSGRRRESVQRGAGGRRSGRVRQAATAARPATVPERVSLSEVGQGVEGPDSAEKDLGRRPTVRMSSVSFGLQCEIEPPIRRAAGPDCGSRSRGTGSRQAPLMRYSRRRRLGEDCRQGDALPARWPAILRAPNRASASSAWRPGAGHKEAAQLAPSRTPTGAGGQRIPARSGEQVRAGRHRTVAKVNDPVAKENNLVAKVNNLVARSNQPAALLKPKAKYGCLKSCRQLGQPLRRIGIASNPAHSEQVKHLTTTGPSELPASVRAYSTEQTLDSHEWGTRSLLAESPKATVQHAAASLPTAAHADRIWSFRPTAAQQATGIPCRARTSEKRCPAGQESGQNAAGRHCVSTPTVLAVGLQQHFGRPVSVGARWCRAWRRIRPALAQAQGPHI
uniref:Doublecortin domain-containing protein n=1 Tax=Macrostomum lignano TaxID=282301 RepID=A0A1I8F9L0_9PLAT